MKNKLNDFDKYLLSDGIDMVHEKMVSEIEKTIASGNQPIMTVGFVGMIVNELKDKLGIDNLVIYEKYLNEVEFNIDNNKVKNVVSKF